MYTYVVNEMPCWSLVWSLILQVKFENTEYLSENYALTKRLKSKNSKVFEQKGDLLNFNVNIDPKSGLMLSCAEPSRASQAEVSWAESSWV